MGGPRPGARTPALALWAHAAVPGAVAVVCAAGAVRLLRQRLTAVTVRGRSMEPGYVDGDRVLVSRPGRLVPGRVVVLERSCPDGGRSLPPLPPGASPEAVRGRHWIVKRIAAVPGDPVPRTTVPALAAVPETRVPPGRLVLLGDNPDASIDSRQVGYFPLDRILGTVMCPLGRSEGTTSSEASVRAAASRSRRARS
ncbi:S26 family signal peptidase [Streptomyces sp. NPDC046931]|uniref:S26 family signal peptidase n=1 Tax=Streptomyces sp. NPDC046931 TaxID=3154806 RepID=UPI0034055DBE